MNPIPENYIDFLHWLKDHTETYWAQGPGTSTNEDKCPLWVYGAKWVGMTEGQIDEVQDRYGITFTPEHREFLKVLHTIDRKEKVYENYDSEEGPYYEQSFFRNWLEDDDISTRQNDVYYYIARDIKENKFWLNSWGPRSTTVEERISIFDELFKKAPKLVPVMAHRYQVADMSLEKRPVLSILGSDVVYYGSDFRYYLLSELKNHLNIYHKEYDKEDQTWYWELNDGFEDTFEYYDKTKLPELPFWKSFVLFDWTNHANNMNL